VTIQFSKLWRPLVIVAALSFVYANVLTKLVRDWWNDENYSHGLLIPFFIGYILWNERARLRDSLGRSSFAFGGAMILFALFVLWAGTAGAELFLQRTSLILLLGGITLYFWGWRLLRAAFFPLTLIAMAIPIPTILLNQITFPLQLFASHCAVWTMQLFKIPVLRQGNVIELMPRGALEPVKLEVVAACSGIRSLMTLVTLAAVFAYFTYPQSKNRSGNDLSGFFKGYGFWRSVLILLAAVPIAIFTNALRVSGTGFLAHSFGMKTAEGFFHTFSGWVIYVLAFALMLAFGWTLDRVEGKRQRAKGKGQKGN
jgi:exosortase